MSATFVGGLACLVAVFGFGSRAGASATVDLIWGAPPSGPGVPVSGSRTAAVPVSSTSDELVLNLVITAGPGGVSSFGQSVDYSNLAGHLALVSFQNQPLGLGPFQFGLGSTTDTGTQVLNFNAAGFGPGLTSGQSYLAGTLRFHKLLGGPGTFTATPLSAPGTLDEIRNLAFESVESTTTYNTAFFLSEIIPEPATSALLGFGLVLMSVIRARSR